MKDREKSRTVSARARGRDGSTVSENASPPSASIKVNGTKVTSNINFIRATRVLNFSSSFMSINKLIELQLIDPLEWLVDFSYWLMATTGVSLAPLLKIWGRLSKKHRLLPYTVILLGLVFLALAVWFVWRWISFQAAHLRL